MHAIPATATTASQRFHEAIQLYSGEWIQLPIKTDVWKTWRNMRIREEMEKVDKNDLRAIREKKKGLAKFWNISFSRVASIYYEERDKFSKEYEELDKICDQIYEEEFAVFEKKMRDLLGKKTEHRKGVVLGPTGEDEE